MMEWMLVSSLTKVFTDERPESWENPGLLLLNNERRAFGIAFFSSCRQRVSLEITGLPHCALWQVVQMKSSYPCHEQVDSLYLRREPGLYPDLLRPMPPVLEAEPGIWQSVWVTVENLPAGEYTAEISLNGDKKQVPVRVLRQSLPPQTIYHTQWLHGDCLADYYGVEVFSPAHWQALEGFLRGAARCGVNMILTPVFTPPLDTEPGGERTTIQLVDVSFQDGRYSFDFEKLRRWTALCLKCGITELEISHLFTQWGAEAAPKIMVLEDGKLQKKFGWHTPAAGGEYTVFLRQFLPALKKTLTDLHMWEHTWFHISDEPGENQREQYQAVKNTVMEFLPEQRCIDALSSFEFYRHGCVQRPVVCEDHLDPFLEAGVPGLFTYYCTAQGLEVPNRFFSMPSGRNRILGVLLYVHNLSGFLHWGLNFYNSQFSKAHIDPFEVTDAGGAFPSGDPFLLYPAPDYSAWPSIRSEVLYEGLEDLRLLQLAEKAAGREKVLRTLEEMAGYPLSFRRYPVEDRFFRAMHDAMIRLAASRR